jgi:Tfp pilus assembly protein PilF
MSLLLPLALLMQVGADPHVYPQAPLPAITPRRQIAKPVPAAPADQLAECMTRGRDDADAGLAFAREWLSRAKTPEDRAQPNQCLGELLTDQGEFAEAQTAFAAAVESIPPAQASGAVPLMAMAGNAALASGDGACAIAWFDRALAVKDYDNPGARGAIMADRARALVALGRTADAAAALADARQQAPGDASVFLLSATLARRGHDLRSAQGFIETAAGLDPVDPAIGLEAGVIAVLAGHDTAARKSWNSVITAAPNSAEAQTARGYLAQLGPDTTAPLDHPATPPTSPSGR